MKRILLNSTLALTLAATAVASPVFAQQATQPSGDATAQQQGRHHGPKDPHKAAMHIGKRLGLSADQTAKLEPILADRQQKIEALRANTTLTPDQRREQMGAIRKDTEAQLSNVLTPDQMQQLRSMHHGPHDRHQGQQPAATTPPSAS